jgi:hypothetical protein
MATRVSLGNNKFGVRYIDAIVVLEKLGGRRLTIGARAEKHTPRVLMARINIGQLDAGWLIFGPGALAAMFVRPITITIN